MSKMSKAIAVLGVVAGLGVAALPLSSYAAVVSGSDAVTVQAVVTESISVTADATDKTVKIDDVSATTGVKTGSTELTVKTNNPSGYNVTIIDEDDVTALTTDGVDAANGIPAAASIDLDSVSKGWAFQSSVAGDSGLTTPTGANTWRQVEASSGTALPIASRATGTSAEDGDKITLTFGAKVDASIAAGTYEDKVVVTATTKN